MDNPSYIFPPLSTQTTSTMPQSIEPTTQITRKPSDWALKSRLRAAVSSMSNYLTMVAISSDALLAFEYAPLFRAWSHGLERVFEGIVRILLGGRGLLWIVGEDGMRRFWVLECGIRSHVGYAGTEIGFFLLHGWLAVQEFGTGVFFSSRYYLFCFDKGRSPLRLGCYPIPFWDCGFTVGMSWMDVGVRQLTCKLNEFIPSLSCGSTGFPLPSGSRVVSG